ncbi:MAG: glycosyltransferase family 2 protein [Verrucomicrobiaceae bacterium]|nr:glycosyltransferase family 2 protein [Verrucomicrobiaceae bacterium]
MKLADITPVILTWNEEPNLGRCLNALHWAREVVIVDSGSTDETERIARSFPNVRWMVRPFDDHTKQWNFGLDAVNTEWVLSLDADYVTPGMIQTECESLPGGPVAWYGAFRYLIHGRPLSASLYPPRALLFKKASCRYEQDGHTQLLKLNGESGHLKSVFDHDDRKPLSRWIASQYKYAELEAAKLMLADGSSLRIQDRLRKWILPAPVMTLVYTLLVKRTILDGWPGIYYTLQRVIAEFMLSLCLAERRLGIK